MQLQRGWQASELNLVCAHANAAPGVRCLRWPRFVLGLGRGRRRRSRPRFTGVSEPVGINPLASGRSPTPPIRCNALASAPYRPQASPQCYFDLPLTSYQ